MDDALVIGPPGGAHPLVALHGFAGTPEDWRPVLDAARVSALALALPGHHPRHPCPSSFESAAASLLARAPGERFDLLAYSLGGRLALGMAALAPERVDRVFLISANPGVEGAAERAARRERDARLAARLRADPAAFFAWWDALPIFSDKFSDELSGEQTRALRDHRARRARLDPSGLADALERLTPGAMPVLRDVAFERAERLTLCVGERDTKYRKLFEDLQARAPSLRLEVVSGAHHRVPVDRPQLLGERVGAWARERAHPPGQ